MIRVAIVEDDVICLNDLKSCFDRYRVEKNCSIEIDSFDTADKFLSEYKTGVYSMVFMDIEMPGTNGMEAAKILRKKDGEVLLFFVTHLAQYALESYEVQTFMFMVKPVVYDNFFIKMERAIRRIGDDAEKQIVVSVKDGDGMMEKVLLISDIKYAEIFGHQTIYHTKNGDIVSRAGSMRSLAAKLMPYGFSMCHQSYLVNLKYITAVGKEEVYIGDDAIKISRQKRKEFLAAVAQYLSLGVTEK